MPPDHRGIVSVLSCSRLSFKEVKYSTAAEEGATIIAATKAVHSSRASIPRSFLIEHSPLSFCGIIPFFFSPRK